MWGWGAEDGGPVASFRSKRIDSCPPPSHTPSSGRRSELCPTQQKMVSYWRPLYRRRGPPVDAPPPQLSIPQLSLRGMASSKHAWRETSAFGSSGAGPGLIGVAPSGGPAVNLMHRHQQPKTTPGSRLSHRCPASGQIGQPAQLDDGNAPSIGGLAVSANMCLQDGK